MSHPSVGVTPKSLILKNWTREGEGEWAEEKGAKQNMDLKKEYICQEALLMVNWTQIHNQSSSHCWQRPFTHPAFQEKATDWAFSLLHCVPETWANLYRGVPVISSQSCSIITNQNAQNWPIRTALFGLIRLQIWIPHLHANWPLETRVGTFSRKNGLPFV